MYFFKKLNMSKDWYFIKGYNHFYFVWTLSEMIYQYIVTLLLVHARLNASTVCLILSFFVILKLVFSCYLIYRFFFCITNECLCDISCHEYLAISVPFTSSARLAWKLRLRKPTLELNTNLNTEAIKTSYQDLRESCTSVVEHTLCTQRSQFSTPSSSR